MLVDGLQEEGFKAVRVAAGDSVSLAISDKGEVRCWGSFRVCTTCCYLVTEPDLADLAQKTSGIRRYPGLRRQSWLVSDST